MSKPKQVPTYTPPPHVRLHVQPFYPVKINGVGGRRMWRLGIEGASAKLIGLERPDEYRYGKDSIELERVDTQREAVALGVARQRAIWDDKGNRATTSLYIHGRDNKILKGNRGERTYPRSADSNPPQGSRARERK